MHSYVPYAKRLPRPLWHAAAQGIGLEQSSVGWALLDRLLTDPSPGSEIWHALAVGKATLILPTEPYDDKIRITHEFIKDHIAFVDARAVQLVTLSGLRGTLHSDTLTFRSALHPSSKLHHALQHASSRAYGFSHLPPLPQPYQHHPTEPEPPVSYPSFTCSAQTLPLPARISSNQTKPPLPPRPLSTVPPGTPHRLPNPFASLFGVGSYPPSAASSPATTAAPLPPETTDSALGTATTTVPVLLVDRSISRRELGRDINAAIGAEIARALTSRGRVDLDAGHENDPRDPRDPHDPHDQDHDQDQDDYGYDIPEWVADRVTEFALSAGMYPFVKETLPPLPHWEQGTGLNKRLVGAAIAGRGAALRSQSVPLKDQEREEAEYASWGVAKWTDKSSEEVAGRVQEFYGALEREVRDRRTRGRETRGEDAGDREADGVVSRVVEAVEGIVSSLFYDRLFSQPTSDDASHDETLSSRTAALNMLDLTLQHLDIDVGEAGEEDVGVVVRACGETLMQLEACRTPKDKAAVLVAAHKVVVDGLSKLPPIKLIPEREQEKSSTPSLPPPPYGGELKEITSTSHKVDDDKEDIYSGDDDDQNEKKQVSLPPDSTSTSASTSTSTSAASKPTSTTTSTPVSGDLLLPFLIFSVVKSNPPHLVSHLLFTQRFRNQIWVQSSSPSSTGEESYCLINLMAVAEFLENVDLEALGLAVAGEGSRPALSPVGLSPILGVGRDVVAAREEVGLRGRVEQQVDAIAGSANKVLAGVMDTSFGMLRSLLPGQEVPHVSGVNSMVGSSVATHPNTSANTNTATTGGGGGSAAWNVRPNFGLLRRESGFSIASIAASLPQAITSRKPGSGGDHPEDGQQMVTVSTSRPFSGLDGVEAYAFGHGEGDVGVELAGGSVVEDGEEGESEGGEGEGGEDGDVEHGSMRSIKSFESMMSERGGMRKAKKMREVGKNVSSMMVTRTTGSGPRKSLSDRLAHMSSLAGIKGSPPVSRRGSLMPTGTSRPTTPQGGAWRVAPPTRRFLECSPDDLKIGEVAELLKEYRRLVEDVRMAGGFLEEDVYAP